MLRLLSVPRSARLSLSLATRRPARLAALRTAATAPIPADSALNSADSALHSADSTVVDLAATVAAGVPHIGELRGLGLGSLSTPVGLVQNMIEALSAAASAPWWLGIVMTTVALRTLVLPVALSAAKNNAVLSRLQPEMQLHSKRMKDCQAAGDMVRPGRTVRGVRLHTLPLADRRWARRRRQARSRRCGRPTTSARCAASIRRWCRRQSSFLSFWR